MITEREIESGYKLILEKFEIYGLFGIFDFKNIKIKSKEGILIIYGVNGTGKTTTLKLISDFKKGQFIKIADVKFDLIKFHFKNVLNGNVLSVEIEKISFGKLKLTIFKNTKRITHILDLERILLSDISNRDLGRIRYLRIRYKHNDISEESFIKSINRTLDKTWKKENLNRLFALLDDPDIRKLRTKSLKMLDDEKHQNFNEELSKIRNSFKCHFIQAQRLDIKQYENIKAESVILDKRMKLKSKIDENLKQYTKISQTQDKDLVERIIINSIEKTDEFSTKPEDQSYSYHDIERELSAFMNKQDAYNRAGLDTSNTVKIDLSKSFQKAMEWDEELKTLILFRILKDVILSDGKKKLEIFDNLYQRIDLFKEIINSHLSKPKHFEIDYKEGFFIKNTLNDEVIKIDLLSSGEKHILILFFELIFETEPYTLFLIDEPEISLHVDWQIKFVKNLLMIKSSKINDLKNFEFIIATHSPQIIHDRWDLATELKREE